MPIPTPDNLFLRDPRNRAFVEGNRDRHKPRYPDDTHPAFSLIIGSIMSAIAGVGTVLAFAEARSTALSGCGPAPEIACYFSGPYALWPCMGGFLVLVVVVTVRELITAVRFPARIRRLREEGAIIYGKVTEHTPWKFQRGDEAPDYYQLTLRYSLPVVGQEAVHEEVIRRDTDAELRLPSAGGRVAVLYVDENLWELL